jgi:hypothetical protein
MTESQVLKLLKRLEIYYDEPHDEHRADRWVQALEPANAGDMDRAAETYMARDPKWFPKPAQLLTLAPTRMGSIHQVEPTSAEEPDPFPGHIVQVAPGCYWFLPPGAQIPTS